MRWALTQGLDGQYNIRTEQQRAHRVEGCARVCVRGACVCAHRAVGCAGAYAADALSSGGAYVYAVASALDLNAAGAMAARKPPLMYSASVMVPAQGARWRWTLKMERKMRIVSSSPSPSASMDSTRPSPGE